MRRSRLMRDKDTASAARTHSQPKVVLRNGRLVHTQPPVNEPQQDQEVELRHEIVPDVPLGGGRKALILLFVVALLLPFNVNLGPLRLTPATFFLLLAFLPMLGIWLFRKPTPITAPDYMILGFVAWAATAIIINQGLALSIEPIGLHILQTLGAFMTGRVLVRDDKSMMFMAKTAVIAGCVLALPAVLESLTGRPVALQLAGLIGPSWPGVNMSPRMGLHRAQASFEHPILFGIFAASLVSLAVYCLPKGAFWKKIGPVGVVVAAVTSFSAGALLSLNMQFGLMLWNYVLRAYENRWKILGVLVVLLYIAVDLVSVRTPFHVLVNYATFSSGSAYTRILIWEYGSAEALRNPFFGIGFGEWERPSYMGPSIDNFWLVQALHYGMPACFLLMGMMILIMVRAGNSNGPGEMRDSLRRGAIFALLGTCVSIGSVHLWNSSYMWLMFLAGSSVWLGLDSVLLSKAGKRKSARTAP